MIATKFGFKIEEMSRARFRQPSGRISEVADASLIRLRTDLIDLFYQHRVDPPSPSRTWPAR